LRFRKEEWREERFVREEFDEGVESKAGMFCRVGEVVRSVAERLVERVDAEGVGKGQSSVTVKSGGGIGGDGRNRSR
jgi:hypothetical protein